jgi:hypothetical protein
MQGIPIVLVEKIPKALIERFLIIMVALSSRFANGVPLIQLAVATP